MPLQTTYRPTTLEEVAGNDPVKESLRSIMTRENKDLPHSFLFTGPSGCGKTTFAFILANMLGCNDLNTFYYNSANTRGIDTIRDISENCRMMAMGGKRKIYIMDECHGITGAAQEALLRVIEEPPSHVFFAFCTTEPEKLKPTFKRRCHQCEVKALVRGDIFMLMKSVLGKDKSDVPNSILTKIAKTCWGSPGQALSLLDSVKDIKDEQKALDMIDDVTVREASIIEICRALVDNRTSGINKFITLQPILKGLTGEAESNRYAILGYLKKVMLDSKVDDRIADIMSCFLDSYMYTGDAKLIFDVFVACKY